MQNIIDLFQELCVTHTTGEKIVKLTDTLADHSPIYLPEVGIICNQQDNPRIVLVSHMDLIRKFDIGFSKGKTFSVEDGIVTGALDNTVTNAVAITAFKKIVKIYPDIELLLTEGEEVGFKGMKQYLTQFNEKSKKTFFLNLDVTNEGVGSFCSVEYDEPNFEIVKKFQEILHETAFFTHERVGDDTCAVVRFGCAGLSYCLPTLDNIHSYKNNTTLEAIEGYYLGLLDLLSSLEYTDPKSDLRGYHLHLAMKSENKTEFDTKLNEIRNPVLSKKYPVFDDLYERNLDYDLDEDLDYDLDYELDEDLDYNDYNGLIGFDEIDPFDRIDKIVKKSVLSEDF